MTLNTPTNLIFIRSADRLSGILIWDTDTTGSNIYYEINMSNVSADLGFNIIKEQQVIGNTPRQAYVINNIFTNTEIYYFKVRSYISTSGSITYSEYATVFGGL